MISSNSILSLQLIQHREITYECSESLFDTRRYCELWGGGVKSYK